ncbi:hypothetical protein M9Y10_043659 [Tritrichomonas musculus]|uniref:Uncharacterized protein n=1 Tax=Tritrichomonas musculus TaxID=1915356 RepID=A0ABR2K0A6_9EUKA
MDKYINEPGEVYSQGEFNFRPFLNQYNRELFYRTNPEKLYDKLINIFRKAIKNHPSNPRFVTHVPFTQQEHESVLKYLLLTKFYNMHDPIHSQPFQIMQVMNGKTQKDSRIYRSAESIIQYLSEIYIRQSTLYDADDQIVFLTSKSHIFPKKEISHTFSLGKHIQSIGMNSERSKIIKVQDILPAAVVIFITDVSPIVVDLSVGVKNKNANPNTLYEACFLMSGASRFLITGPPEFCSDKHRFCCFYEHGTLNFIDLKHRVKFKNKDTVIPSFKCWPYPCYEALSKLCACTDPNDDDNMIIATMTDTGTISTWIFHSLDRTVTRTSYGNLNIRPKKFEWIPGRRLAVVTEDDDIKIIPWDDKDLDIETYTMDPPHHFVECQGDAYVLEEGPNYNYNHHSHNNSNNNTNNNNNSNNPDFLSSSNVSDNEDDGGFDKNFVNPVIVGRDHLIKIFTFDNEQFEIEVDQSIDTCAYNRGNFAMTTKQGQIFIFDKNVKYARTCITENLRINYIVPVEFSLDNVPLFARVSRNGIKFFDNHGNTSNEWQMENPNTLSIIPFFHKYGFCVAVSKKFEMEIKWFN